MPDDNESESTSESAASNKGVANGGNAELRRDRRADDTPLWFQRWQEREAARRAPASDDDGTDDGTDDGDDDGILSIEELPDLVDDALDKGKELVESIPERVPFLFRKWGGSKAQK